MVRRHEDPASGLARAMITGQADMFREFVKGEPRDSWETPQPLFDSLNKAFGPFTLDAAASEGNHKCSHYFTTEGLISPWFDIDGKPANAFCNPPFSAIGDWVEKAYDEAREGVYVAMLLPAHRCALPWFHDWVIGKAYAVHFIRGRTAYSPPPGIKDSTPAFGSMVVAYADPRDRGTQTAVRSWPL